MIGTKLFDAREFHEVILKTVVAPTLIDLEDKTHQEAFFRLGFANEHIFLKLVIDHNL